MKKGLIHIYFGDGKGKTSAALGLAMRALGHGLSVKFYQFMKCTPTGELNSLKKHERISVIRADGVSSKFLWEMSDAEKAECLDAQQQLFDSACDAAQSRENDVVILDEILNAVDIGAISEAELKYLMTRKNGGTELVLTGRHASRELTSLADYVTQFVKVSHPHDSGAHARRGVEY